MFLVNGVDVRCTWSERDRYNHALATCYGRDADINAMMVEIGMALAYRHYSGIYIEQEERAKVAKRGLWDADFVPPWKWRREVRLDASDDPDCPVKGNVNQRGARIYHVRGWRDYAKVKINADEGDRCFHSKDEAEAAGFRAAMQ